MKMRFAPVMALMFGALFAANAALAAPASDGYYRQSWRDKPDTAWRTVGIAELKTGEHAQLQYIAATYCGSGLVLPDQPASVQVDDKSLVAMLSFPPAPQRPGADAPSSRPADQTAEYRLKADAPGTYSGEVVFDGHINGYTRLERLPDNAAVVEELKVSLQRIRAQKIVREQNVKIAYMWVIYWQREVANEQSLSIRAGGSAMPNTRTPLLFAAARSTHMMEQAQLLRTQAAEQQVMEMIVRAEASLAHP